MGSWGCALACGVGFSGHMPPLKRVKTVRLLRAKCIDFISFF